MQVLYSAPAHPAQCFKIKKTSHCACLCNASKGKLLLLILGVSFRVGAWHSLLEPSLLKPDTCWFEGYVWKLQLCCFFKRSKQISFEVNSNASWIVALAVNTANGTRKILPMVLSTTLKLLPNVSIWVSHLLTWQQHFACTALVGCTLQLLHLFL